MPLSKPWGKWRSPLLSFLTEDVFLPRLARTSLIIALLFGSAYTPQKEFKYAVRGRVVDAQGQPVQGAIVHLDPLLEASQIFGSTTGEDGKFQLEDCTRASRPIRRLYVTGPIPPDTSHLITPPFNLWPKLTDPAFAGQPIPMGHDQEIDVGDVAVQITYTVVKVYVLDHDGAALFKTRQDWADVYLRIRNTDRVIVEETSLSKRDVREAVNASEASLAVAVPEGVWYLELAPFGPDGPWLSSSDQLIVRRGSSPLQYTFRARAEKGANPINAYKHSGTRPD